MCHFVFIFILLSSILFAKNTQTSCVPLKQIDLNENDLFTKKEQVSIFKKYINTCISGQVIKNIIKDTSKYYMDNGYITTKAYLKVQDISDGQIDIKIVKSTIENIIDFQTKKHTWNIKTAFPFQINQSLNLRDLETSLEMINRVPSIDAKFDIIAGSKKSTSLIVVKRKLASPYHINLGATGTRSLENYNPNLTAILSYDNLLNINDIISYSYNGSKIQKKYQSTKGYEYNYSFPIGSFLLEFIYSNTKYRQGVVGINNTYLSNGITKTKKFKLSKVLTRNQNNKLSVSASIYHKDTKNYFSNELIEVSSYKTTLAQIDFIHTYLSSWGQINTTYSYSSGKDWFGARDDSYNSTEVDTSNTANLEFQKYNINSSFLYYFKDKSYKLNSTFHLQYTDDVLYNNDQLTIGSDYTVRGYDSSNLFGNNGHYLKNNLTKTFHPNIHTKIIQSISLFIGLDYGRIKCESNNKNNCGKIYGSAIGFKTNAKNVSTDFTWSRPQKSIGDDFKRENRFKYNLNIKF